jgi:hypothetical protein
MARSKNGRKNYQRNFTVILSEYKRDKIIEYRDTQFMSREYDVPLDFDWKIEEWAYDNFVKGLEKTMFVFARNLEREVLPELVSFMKRNTDFSDFCIDAFINKIKAMPKKHFEKVSIWLPTLVGQPSSSSFVIDVYNIKI